MSRPFKSQIRQNIIEIINYLGPSYGYEIYKIYKAVYPKATLRVIYYHLKRGSDIGEFKIDKVERSKGEYSWGGESEKKIYALGSKAKPKGDHRVKEYLEKKPNRK